LSVRVAISWIGPVHRITFQYCYAWKELKGRKTYDLCLNTEIKSDRMYVPNVARNRNSYKSVIHDHSKKIIFQP